MFLDGSRRNAMASSLGVPVVASRDKVEWSLLFLGHLDEFARLAWYLVANDKLVENVILRTMNRLDEIPFDGSAPDLAYNQARQILIQQSIEVVELDREDEFVPMPPTLAELPNLVRLAFMLKLILRSPEGEVAKFLRVTPDRVGELVQSAVDSLSLRSPPSLLTGCFDA
jgi:hypothetical protein